MRIKALDSLRGMLLLQMTLVHFGKPISQYVYQDFGFFSDAEGFFFLSGFVCMLAAKSKSAKDPRQFWMVKRSLRIWAYHIASLTLVCGLAFLCLPRIQWFFAPFSNHTAGAIPLAAILCHTPLYFDVLPLYVILMLAGSLLFPLYVKAKNHTQITLLWLPSVILWGIAQTEIFHTITISVFPKWVYHGDFHPFSWQFVYFTGAAAAAWWNLANNKAKRTINNVSPWLILPFAFCFLWSHGFLPLEKPEQWLTNKQFLGPLRTANFFIFVVLISSIVRKWPTALDFKITNTIGRHSLDVYTFQTILVFLWFAFPKEVRYSEPWSIVAPFLACLLLWVLSKFREPR